MKFHIAYVLSLIAIVTFSCAHSQTNLICNYSFENVNQDAIDRLNEADWFHPTHFYSWGESYPNYPSVFECWERDNDHALIGTPTEIDGISFAITPGLFPTSDGEIHNYYAFYPNDPLVTTDTDGNYRAFMDDNQTSGITLSTNTDGLHGIDLSPPTTKFGENVYATDGNSYAALLDMENRAWSTVPSLFTELKYALQKDVEYTFSMDFCKMNLLGYLKDTEGWDHVEDGKIEVYISYDEAPLSPRQKICEIMADDNAWDVTTWNFIAERSYTHLLIEFDPIKGQILAPTSSKIAGVFIDNVKLYEACETPDNMCNNANYKRDMLNVQLDEVNLYSALAFPDDEGNDDGYFETVRVKNLDNVKRFEIKIKYNNTNTVCYQHDMWYPPSEWIWDGKDFNGDPVPEGQYDAIINAVSNDCFHITDADHIQFDIKRKYSVFNIWSSTNVEDGNTFVNGLDNVHHLNVELYTLSGQLVHSFDLTNPPNSIGLSLPSIIAYGNAGNGQVASGYYNIKLTAENNCTEEFSTTLNYINLSGINDSTTPSPFYDWSPVPKPEFFPCPFDMSYHQNYLAPMNCCEGNLYINNVEIWNDWNVQIWDTIFAGPNVIFQPGVTNYLLAGEQVVLLPDETGVIVADGTIIDAGTLNCPHCKIADAPNTDPDTENPRDIVYADMQDSLALKENLEPILYPNPAANGQELTVKAGKQPFDENSYKLVLSNTVGVEVPLKILSASPRMIRFKPATVVPVGAYYLYLESGGVQQTFNVVVR